MGRKKSLFDCFEDKYIPEPNSGCWLWTSTLNDSGYGVLMRRINGKSTPLRAHRVSWEVHNGPIIGGLFVCHKCDNRMCVNPDHLFLGTNAENMEDCANKGRMSKPPLHKGEKHHKAKLTEDQVREIRASKLLLREISEKYGVCKATASYIRRGELWRDVVDAAGLP